jgi:predicted Zn-dependent protease/O-acetyl-ADP-ribose deacetylase (regulator of RNase III)/fructose-1,6-bisphosphatase/inositol monophosphatase family enzyme/ADP-ribose pyrophosphatase YjhB (NUDIX family)
LWPERGASLGRPDQAAGGGSDSPALRSPLGRPDQEENIEDYYIQGADLKRSLQGEFVMHETYGVGIVQSRTSLRSRDSLIDIEFYDREGRPKIKDATQESVKPSSGPLLRFATPKEIQAFHAGVRGGAEDFRAYGERDLVDVPGEVREEVTQILDREDRNPANSYLSSLDYHVMRRMQERNRVRGYELDQARQAVQEYRARQEERRRGIVRLENASAIERALFLLFLPDLASPVHPAADPINPMEMAVERIRAHFAAGGAAVTTHLGALLDPATRQITEDAMWEAINRVGSHQTRKRFPWFASWVGSRRNGQQTGFGRAWVIRHLRDVVPVVELLLSQEFPQAGIQPRQTARPGAAAPPPAAGAPIEAAKRLGIREEIKREEEKTKLLAELAQVIDMIERINAQLRAVEADLAVDTETMNEAQGRAHADKIESKLGTAQTAVEALAKAVDDAARARYVEAGLENLFDGLAGRLRSAQSAAARMRNELAALRARLDEFGRFGRELAEKRAANERAAAELRERMARFLRPETERGASMGRPDQAADGGSDSPALPGGLGQPDQAAGGGPEPVSEADLAALREKIRLLLEEDPTQGFIHRFEWNRIHIVADPAAWARRGPRDAQEIFVKVDETIARYQRRKEERRARGQEALNLHTAHAVERLVLLRFLEFDMADADLPTSTILSKIDRRRPVLDMILGEKLDAGGKIKTEERARILNLERDPLERSGMMRAWTERWPEAQVLGWLEEAFPNVEFLLTRLFQNKEGGRWEGAEITREASALRRERRHGEAERLLRGNADKYPNNSVLFTIWADTLIQLRRSREAIPIAERAYQISPDDPVIHDTLARAYFGAREIPKGLEVIRRALSLFPEDAGLYVAAANGYLLAGAVGDARQIARQAARKFPGNPRILTMVAKVHLAARDPASALRAAEEAVRLAPRDRVALDILSGAYVENGDAAKGLEIANEAARRYPRDTFFRSRQAQALVALGRSREAIDLLESAVAEFPPDDPALRNSLGRLYERTGNLERSIEISERLFDNFPADRMARGRILARLYLRAGRIDQAVALFERMLQEFPEDPRLWDDLTDFYLKAGRKGEAQAHAEKAASRWPDEARAQNMLTTVYRKLGLADQALRQARKSLDLFPANEVTLDILARLLVELGRIDEAVRTVDKSARAHPHNFRILVTASQVHREAGHREQAVAYAEAARAEAPYDAYTWVNLAEAYVAGGLAHKAVQVALEAREGFPENDVVRNTLAKAYSAAGDYAKTVETAEETVRLFPDDPVARTILANALKDLRDFGRAVQAAQETVRLFPDDPIARNTLTNILLAAGRLDEALESVRSELRVNPRDARARSTLIQVHRARKEFAQALEEVQENVRLWPHDIGHHHTLIQVYLDMGRSEEVLRAVLEHVRRFSRDVSAHVLAVRILTGRGDLDAALARAREAARNFSADPRARTLLIDTLFARGDAEEAINLAEVNLREHPQYEGTYHALANHYARSGQAAQAIVIAQRAVREFPHSGNARHLLERMQREAAGAEVAGREAAPATVAELRVRIGEEERKAALLEQLRLALEALARAEQSLAETSRHVALDLESVDLAAGFESVQKADTALRGLGTGLPELKGYFVLPAIREELEQAGLGEFARGFDRIGEHLRSMESAVARQKAQAAQAAQVFREREILRALKAQNQARLESLRRRMAADRPPGRAQGASLGRKSVRDTHPLSTAADFPSYLYHPRLGIGELESASVNLRAQDAAAEVLFYRGDGSHFVRGFKGGEIAELYAPRPEESAAYERAKRWVRESEPLRAEIYAILYNDPPNQGFRDTVDFRTLRQADDMDALGRMKLVEADAVYAKARGAADRYQQRKQKRVRSTPETMVIENATYTERVVLFHLLGWDPRDNSIHTGTVLQRLDAQKKNLAALLRNKLDEQGQIKASEVERILTRERSGPRERTRTPIVNIWIQNWGPDRALGWLEDAVPAVEYMLSRVPGLKEAGIRPRLLEDPAFVSAGRPGTMPDEALQSMSGRDLRLHASLLIKEGRREEAVKALELGTERFPQNIFLWTMLADTLAGLGRFDRAIAIARKATDQFPKSPYVRDVLAQVLEKAGPRKESLVPGEPPAARIAPKLSAREIRVQETELEQKRASQMTRLEGALDQVDELDRAVQSAGRDLEADFEAVELAEGMRLAESAAGMLSAMPDKIRTVKTYFGDPSVQEELRAAVLDEFAARFPQVSRHLAGLEGAARDLEKALAARQAILARREQLAGQKAAVEAKKADLLARLKGLKGAPGKKEGEGASLGTPHGAGYGNATAQTVLESPRFTLLKRAPARDILSDALAKARKMDHYEKMRRELRELIRTAAFNLMVQEVPPDHWFQIGDLVGALIVGSERVEQVRRVDLLLNALIDKIKIRFVETETGFFRTNGSYRASLFQSDPTNGAYFYVPVKTGDGEDLFSLEERAVIMAYDVAYWLAKQAGASEEDADRHGWEMSSRYSLFYFSKPYAVRDKFLRMASDQETHGAIQVEMGIKRVGGKMIQLVDGDVTAQDVDAIVNPSNPFLLFGIGVGGHIRRRGGESIVREAAAKAPIQPGEAVSTRGGKLRAKHVIHAAVSDMNRTPDLGVIENATRNALREADRLGLKTMAFPAFGTGVINIPYRDSARVMLAVIEDHLKNGKTSLERVMLVLYEKEGYDRFLEVLSGRPDQAAPVDQAAAGRSNSRRRATGPAGGGSDYSPARPGGTGSSLGNLPAVGVSGEVEFEAVERSVAVAHKYRTRSSRSVIDRASGLFGMEHPRVRHLEGRVHSFLEQKVPQTLQGSAPVKISLPGIPVTLSLNLAKLWDLVREEIFLVETGDRPFVAAELKMDQEKTGKTFSHERIPEGAYRVAVRLASAGPGTQSEDLSLYLPPILFEQRTGTAVSDDAISTALMVEAIMEMARRVATRETGGIITREGALALAQARGELERPDGPLGQAGLAPALRELAAVKARAEAEWTARLMREREAGIYPTEPGLLAVAHSYSERVIDYVEVLDALARMAQSGDITFEEPLKPHASMVLNSLAAVLVKNRAPVQAFERRQNGFVDYRMADYPTSHYTRPRVRFSLAAFGWRLMLPPWKWLNELALRIQLRFPSILGVRIEGIPQGRHAIGMARGLVERDTSKISGYGESVELSELEWEHEWLDHLRAENAHLTDYRLVEWLLGVDASWKRDVLTELQDHLERMTLEASPQNESHLEPFGAEELDRLEARFKDYAAGFPLGVTERHDLAFQVLPHIFQRLFLWARTEALSRNDLYQFMLWLKILLLVTPAPDAFLNMYFASDSSQEFLDRSADFLAKRVPMSIDRKDPERAGKLHFIGKLLGELNWLRRYHAEHGHLPPLPPTRVEAPPALTVSLTLDPRFLPAGMDMLQVQGVVLALMAELQAMSLDLDAVLHTHLPQLIPQALAYARQGIGYRIIARPEGSPVPQEMELVPAGTEPGQKEKGSSLGNRTLVGGFLAFAFVGMAFHLSIRPPAGQGAKSRVVPQPATEGASLTEFFSAYSATSPIAFTVDALTGYLLRAVTGQSMGVSQVTADLKLLSDYVTDAVESKQGKEEPRVLIVLGNPYHRKYGRVAAEIYAKMKMKPKHVLFSGKGRGREPEAILFRRAFEERLRELGVSYRRHGTKVHVETDSMYTAQNAQFSARLLQKMAPNDRGLQGTLSIGLVQMPTGSRLSRLLFEHDFKWSHPVSFRSYPPTLAAPSTDRQMAGILPHLDHALGQIERFQVFAERGWIEPKAGKLPEEVVAAAQRLRMWPPLIRYRLELLQRHASTRLTPRRISRLMGLVKRAKLKLTPEDLDILALDKQGREKVIGSASKAVAHELGLLHRTANAFILTPQGKILIQRRVHNKQQPLRLSIFGGHVSSVSTYEEAIRREIREELGLREGRRLRGQMIVIGKEGGFASPRKTRKDRKNPERRATYIYRATPAELKEVGKVRRILRSKMKSMTRAQYEAWLEQEQARHKGFGEVWNIYEFTLEELMDISRSKDAVLRDAFKDGIAEDRAELTSDLLAPLLRKKNIVDMLTQAVQVTEGRGVAPKAGKAESLGIPPGLATIFPQSLPSADELTARMKSHPRPWELFVRSAAGPALAIFKNREEGTLTTGESPWGAQGLDWLDNVEAFGNPVFGRVIMPFAVLRPVSRIAAQEVEEYAGRRKERYVTDQDFGFHDVLLLRSLTDHLKLTDARKMQWVVTREKPAQELGITNRAEALKVLGISEEEQGEFENRFAEEAYNYAHRGRDMGNAESILDHQDFDNPLFLNMLKLRLHPELPEKGPLVHFRADGIESAKVLWSTAATRPEDASLYREAIHDPQTGRWYAVLPYREFPHISLMVDSFFVRARPQGAEDDVYLHDIPYPDSKMRIDALLGGWVFRPEYRHLHDVSYTDADAYFSKENAVTFLRAVVARTRRPETLENILRGPHHEWIGTETKQLAESRLAALQASSLGDNIQVAWKHPEAEVIVETLLGDFEEMPREDELRTKLKLKGLKPGKIQQAARELYRDPTQHIEWGLDMAGLNLRNGLERILKSQVRHLRGPAEAILVRKAVPGESDEPAVQLIGTTLVFTLIHGDDQTAAQRELESLIPQVRRETMDALKQGRATLGMESRAAVAFFRKYARPFAERLKGRAFDDVLSPDDRAALETLLAKVPGGQGVFERSIQVSLPETLTVGEVWDLEEDLQKKVFLPAGYYFDSDDFAIVRLVRMRERSYLERPLATYFFDEVEGKRGSFSSRDLAFVNVGAEFQTLRAEMKWAAEHPQGHRGDIRAFVAGYLKDVPDRKAIFDVLIDTLIVPAVDEAMRRYLEEVTQEEESHAEHYIFASRVARKGLAHPSLDPSKYLPKLGGLFLEQSIASFVLPKVSEGVLSMEAFWTMFLGGTREIVAAFERILNARDKGRELLLYAGQPREQKHFQFTLLVLPLIEFLGNALFGGEEDFLRALRANPNHVIGQLMWLIYAASFYTREERERILAATPEERPRVLLDLVPMDGMVDRAQIELVKEQFGMETDAILELTRGRADFREEEGHFIKIIPETGSSLGNEGMGAWKKGLFATAAGFLMGHAMMESQEARGQYPAPKPPTWEQRWENLYGHELSYLTKSPQKIRAETWLGYRQRIAVRFAGLIKDGEIPHSKLSRVNDGLSQGFNLSTKLMESKILALIDDFEKAKGAKAEDLAKDVKAVIADEGLVQSWLAVGLQRLAASSQTDAPLLRHTAANLSGGVSKVDEISFENSPVPHRLKKALPAKLHTDVMKDLTDHVNYVKGQHEAVVTQIEKQITRHRALVKTWRQKGLTANQKQIHLIDQVTAKLKESISNKAKRAQLDREIEDLEKQIKKAREDEREATGTLREYRYELRELRKASGFDVDGTAAHIVALFRKESGRRELPSPAELSRDLKRPPDVFSNHDDGILDALDGVVKGVTETQEVRDRIASAVVREREKLEKAKSLGDEKGAAFIKLVRARDYPGAVRMLVEDDEEIVYGYFEFLSDVGHRQALRELAGLRDAGLRDVLYQVGLSSITFEDSGRAAEVVADTDLATGFARRGFLERVPLIFALEVALGFEYDDLIFESELREEGANRQAALKRIDRVSKQQEDIYRALIDVLMQEEGLLPKPSAESLGRPGQAADGGSALDAAENFAVGFMTTEAKTTFGSLWAGDEEDIRKRLDAARESKLDRTEVTKWDRALERRFREGVAPTFPEDAVVGEEFPGENRTAKRTWTVDPIDGTSELLAMGRYFGSITTLFEEGIPQVSVTYWPLLDLDGSGSSLFVARRDRAEILLNGKPVTPNLEAMNRSDSVLLYAPDDAARPEEFEVLKRFFESRGLKVVRTYANEGRAMEMMMKGTFRLFLHLAPGVHDSAAIAFFAEKAGLKVSDRKNLPVFPLNLEDLKETLSFDSLAIGTEESHALALEALRELGSSLGDAKPQAILKFERETGRDASSVFWVAGRYAGRTLKLDDQVVFSWFYNGLFPAEESQAENRRALAFNLSLEPTWQRLQSLFPAFDTGDLRQGGFYVADEPIFSASEAEAEEAAARVIASLAPKDFFAFVVGGKIAPRILSEMHKKANGTEVEIQGVQRALAQAYLPSLASKAKTPPLVITALEGRELTVKIRGTTYVKFDLKVLVENGIDPVQVLALLRRIADYPSLRRQIFEAVGFEPAGGSSWVVGAKFVKTVLDEVYTEKVADTILARAA